MKAEENDGKAAKRNSVTIIRVPRCNSVDKAESGEILKSIQDDQGRVSSFEVGVRDIGISHISGDDGAKCHKKGPNKRDHPVSMILCCTSKYDETSRPNNSSQQKHRYPHLWIELPAIGLHPPCDKLSEG